MHPTSWASSAYWLHKFFHSLETLTGIFCSSLLCLYPFISRGLGLQLTPEGIVSSQVYDQRWQIFDFWTTKGIIQLWESKKCQNANRQNMFLRHSYFFLLYMQTHTQTHTAEFWKVKKGVQSYSSHHYGSVKGI